MAIPTSSLRFKPPDRWNERCRAAEPSEPPEETEVLFRGEGHEDIGFLWDDPHQGLRPVRFSQHVNAEDVHAATRRAQLAGDLSHQCCLSGTVGTEQPKHHAAGHAKINGIIGQHAVFEALAEVSDVNSERCTHASPTPTVKRFSEWPTR
jgi:hypothetical protein